MKDFEISRYILNENFFFKFLVDNENELEYRFLIFPRLQVKEKSKIFRSFSFLRGKDRNK